MLLNKITSGDSKGKYRSSLGHVYSARQIQFRKQQRNVPVGDAAPQSRDPTGTLQIRKSLARDLTRAWILVKREVRSTVGKADSFGLAQYGPNQLAAMAATGGQVHAFSVWLDTVQSRLLGRLYTALETAVGVGYAQGATHAQVQAKKRLQEPLAGPSVVLASAVKDLEGIGQAVVQQATRVFSDMLIKKAKPQVAARLLGAIIDKIGRDRSSLLASYCVVRAHATGTLDALQALGVKRVGIIPESEPISKGIGRSISKDIADHVHDAVELGKVKFRVPALVPKPKASEIIKAQRVERKLERSLGNLVNVQTAGDDKVCPICERIEEEGPYTIDEARGLIPAHARCRCAYIPI